MTDREINIKTDLLEREQEEHLKEGENDEGKNYFHNLEKRLKFEVVSKHHKK